MTFAEAMTLIGVVIAVGSIVVSAVWAVSSIKKDIALLRQSIGHLTSSVKALRTELKHVDERSDDHERRLVVLETRGERGGPGNRAAASQ